MANIKHETKSKEAVAVPNISDENVMSSAGKSKANFICFTNTNIRGTRINLDTLESYAPNTDTSIQLGRATGRVTLTFTSKEERDEALARLDSYCL